MTESQFALREFISSDGSRGFALCDVKTGDIIEGQIQVCITTESGVSTTWVQLELHNLPLFNDSSR